MNPRWTLPIAAGAVVVALFVGYLIGNAGMGGLESDLTAAREDLAVSQERALSLSEDLQAATSELSATRNDFAELEAQIAQLQADLEEAKAASPPKPEPEPQPNANPNPPPGVIAEDGIWQAGPEGDFPPGTYRAPGGGRCYWARLRSPNPNAIIVNGLGQNPTVEIEPRDWFETADCGVWEQIG